MRANEEILHRVEKIRNEDFFGTRTWELVKRLPFELAAKFLKPEAKGDEWKVVPSDDETVKTEMLEYMPFAWDKANECRGLSAARSLDHFCEWLWLLGDDALSESILTYSHYGKPQLKQICDKFGWDYKQWWNGLIGNSEDSQVKISEL